MWNPSTSTSAPWCNGRSQPLLLGRKPTISTLAQGREATAGNSSLNAHVQVFHPNSPGLVARGQSTRAKALAHPEFAKQTAESDIWEPVRRWFQFVNMRDANAMGRLLADDFRHFDLLNAGLAGGKADVVAAYHRFVSSLPLDVSFVVDDVSAGSTGKICVSWHMLLVNQRVPNAHGVSWFSVDSNNRIFYVRESPDHFVRGIEVLLPAMNAAGPFLKAGLPTTLQSDGQVTQLSDLFLRPEALVADVTNQLSMLAPMLVGLNPATQGSTSSDGLVPFANEWQSALQDLGISIPFLPLAPTAQVHPTFAVHSPLAFMPQVTDAPPPKADEPSEPAATTTQNTKGVEISMRPLAQTVRQEPSTSGRDDVSVLTSMPVQLDATSSAESTPIATAQDPTPPVLSAGDLAGVWKKIPELSDVAGYGRCLDLMGVGGIQKSTALMIDGMEVQHTQDKFAVFYLTIVPYFKVTEGYEFDKEVKLGRRDLRSGHQTASARQSSERVIIDLQWGSPHAGSGHEEYWLNSDGQLCAESSVTVNGQTSTTLQVYARQNAALDNRYYGKKQELPFGIDANKISSNLMSMFD